MRRIICLAFLASLMLASTYAYALEAAHPPLEDESIIGKCPNNLNFYIFRCLKRKAV